MRIALLAAVVLATASDPASAQRVERAAAHAPTSAAFAISGKVIRERTIDAGNRSFGALIGATIGMGFGYGLDRLNAQSCFKAICNAKSVQTMVSWAYLGGVVGATGRNLHSECPASLRSIFSLIGGAVGVAVAGKFTDISYFTATHGEKATFPNMWPALAGASLGSGIFASFC